MKIGILDIGTNSIHLILVEIRKDMNLEILDRDKEITRLGDTSFNEGCLSEAALYRGISAIRRFKKLADIHGIQKIKAVATSAVREAVNGGDFIEMIRKETGIKVDVITGDEEARLIYLAVKHSIPFSKKPTLIIDIGGGSVEIIIADENELKACWSLKLGVLRLTSQLIKNDPPTKKELAHIQEAITLEMAPILKKAKELKVATIVGTSGSIMNLGTMARALHSSNGIEFYNNLKITRASLVELDDILKRQDRKSRLKIKGIDLNRVDTIIPGSAVVRYVMEHCGFEELILCDEAIREGLVYDFLEKNRTKIELENKIPDMRMRSVMQLAKKCDYPEPHVQHVLNLTLALFDQLQGLHGLGARERELIKHATLLHDIGYHINYKKHHKHSYYLIKNGDLNGFEEGEIEIIANIARYHSKSYPKKAHDNWDRLTEEDQKTVFIGAALLRIADALDRSHFSVVREIFCQIMPDRVTMDITPNSDPELEIWTANRKKDLFEEVFQRKVLFHTKAIRTARPIKTKITTKTKTPIIKKKK